MSKPSPPSSRSAPAPPASQSSPAPPCSRSWPPRPLQAVVPARRADRRAPPCPHRISSNPLPMMTSIEYSDRPLRHRCSCPDCQDRQSRRNRLRRRRDIVTAAAEQTVRAGAALQLSLPSPPDRVSEPGRADHHVVTLAARDEADIGHRIIVQHDRRTVEVEGGAQRQIDPGQRIAIRRADDDDLVPEDQPCAVTRCQIVIRFRL